MKTFFILLILICSATNTIAQIYQLSEYEDTKGLYKLSKVKELKVYGYAETLDSAILIAHVKYDTLGNILSARSFPNDNTALNFDTLIYNARHKLIEKITYRSDNKIDHDSLIYDENDSLKIKFQFNWDESYSTTNYGYNKPGKQVRNENYKGDTLISGCFTKYDAGNRILRQTYYGTSPFFTQADYIYDNEGRISQEIFTSKTNIYTTTYKYNEANKLISQFSVDNKNKSLFTYKYDSAGNMIEIVFNSAWGNSITNHQSIFKYYSNNLLFETKSFVNGKPYWKEKRFYVFY